MNKPLAIADQPFKIMNTNTSKEKSFYTQGKQCIVRVLLSIWLLTSYSPGSTLAAPEHQTAMEGTRKNTLSMPFGGFWSPDPATENTPQQDISQEVVPDQEGQLLSTFPEASPVEENLFFQARGGESVCFHYHQGQWRAKVSSRIGPFSRQTVLPVVCSQGENVASSLEVLSRYPSWQRQRQIHVLDRNVCPTLGEVVYVGELGLKGGGPIPSFCDSIGCSSSVLSSLQVELEHSDYGRFRTTVDPNSCMRPHTFPSNSRSTSPCDQCKPTPNHYYQPLDFDLPTTRVADIRLGYFCHPFIVGVAADSADASRSHTASSASASCLSVDLGNQGIVQLYQHDGNWRTYCQKYNIHGWLRASKRKQLSIHDLSIYRIVIHTCRDCCLPCVIATPKYAANQSSANDQAAQWKVVAHDGKLALQEVDGGALWVPNGKGNASLEDLARTEVKAVPEKATIVGGVSGAEAKSAAGLAAVSPPRGCTVSNYVNVADDADATSKGNILSIDLKLNSGEKMRLYPWDSKWVAHVFKHDIIVWVRAESPLSLSATALKVYVWPSYFCTTCCPPCVVLTPPKYAANQPSATDPATKWKVVAYDEKLALQEVDEGAIWVPKGKGSALCGGPLIDPDILRAANRTSDIATFAATGAMAAVTGPVGLLALGLTLTGSWLFFPQKCVLFNYVSVADDADAEAEEDTPNVDLNLASGEAVWFYPLYGKVWVAYLRELDIVVWVKSKDPISVSANTLRLIGLSAVYDSTDDLERPRAIVSAFLSDPLGRLAKYSNCVVVTTPKEEISKVREQSKKQRQEAKRQREEARRAEQRKREAARKALVQKIASQDTTESTTHFRQFLSQSSAEQQQQTRLQHALQHLGEQATDQQALTSEAMVAPSADVGLTDHQFHPTAAQDQDTSQPLTAAHQGHRMPTDYQPIQEKPKQQRYLKKTSSQKPKRLKTNLFQTDTPISLKYQREDRPQKPKVQTIDTRMIAAYLLEADRILYGHPQVLRNRQNSLTPSTN